MHSLVGGLPGAQMAQGKSLGVTEDWASLLPESWHRPQLPGADS